MKIRDTFKTSFFVNETPVWRCAGCLTGWLVPRKESLAEEESRESIADRDHDGWEPEWITGRFCCMFFCNNAACKEPVAVCGTSRVEPAYQEDAGDPSHEMRFFPVMVLPPPSLFDPPTELPKEILTELSRSFSLFWNDHSGCANAIRSVIEMVLTERKIKRSTLTKKKKMQRLTLHARIELYKKKRPELADAALAVKWIGNAGSHAGDSTPAQSDLFDGFDLLKHFLDGIYEDHSRSMTKLAKAIVKKKGPMSKKRRKKT